jgi:hypothetical protein
MEVIYMKYIYLAVQQLLVFALLGVVINCSVQSPTPTLQPGKLSLLPFQGLGRAVAGQPDDKVISGSYIFQLGEIKSSRDFYFLIQNVGDFPISDISISTTNTSLYVTPSTINLLEPVQQSSILQVLRVTAVHGTALDGVGRSAMMPMGANSTIISISGTTTDSSQSTLITSTNATLEVMALVMDIGLYTDDTCSEPATVTFGSSPGPAGLQVLIGYAPCRILKNLGNVNLTVMRSSTILTILSPNQTMVIDATNGGGFSIDGNNTVCDYTKYQPLLGDDGLLYFQAYIEQPFI